MLGMHTLFQELPLPFNICPKEYLITVETDTKFPNSSVARAYSILIMQNDIIKEKRMRQLLLHNFYRNYIFILYEYILVLHLFLWCRTTHFSLPIKGLL